MTIPMSTILTVTGVFWSIRYVNPAIKPTMNANATPWFRLNDTL